MDGGVQVSQEAGQMVWYSHLFQNFPQCIVIHTVKDFGIVNTRAGLPIQPPPARTHLPVQWNEAAVGSGRFVVLDWWRAWHKGSSVWF